jgi:hypothetical protein
MGPAATVHPSNQYDLAVGGVEGDARALLSYRRAGEGVVQ